MDLYDYATRVEYLGVGVWGNKLGVPDWTADELSAAFLHVLDKSERAQDIRVRAKQLGKRFNQVPGSVCAANHLAALATLKKP